MMSRVQRSPRMSSEHASGQGERRASSGFSTTFFDFNFGMAKTCHTYYLQTTSNITCLSQVIWHPSRHEYGPRTETRTAGSGVAETRTLYRQVVICVAALDRQPRLFQRAFSK